MTLLWGESDYAESSWLMLGTDYDDGNQTVGVKFKECGVSRAYFFRRILRAN